MKDKIHVQSCKKNLRDEKHIHFVHKYFRCCVILPSTITQCRQFCCVRLIESYPEWAPLSGTLNVARSPLFILLPLYNGLQWGSLTFLNSFQKFCQPLPRSRLTPSVPCSVSIIWLPEWGLTKKAALFCSRPLPFGRCQSGKSLLFIYISWFL